MNKIRFSVLICLLLIGCTSTAPLATSPAPTATSAPKIAHLVAFGDSYSDNGNFYKIATELAKVNQMDPDWWPWAKKIYWENPITNQPTAVEVLADRLKADLNDFATGGAFSSTRNANDVADLFSNTGLLGQIDKYVLTELAGEKMKPETLAVVQAPISDFLILETHDAQHVRSAAQQEIANLILAVNQLAKAGAKQILVINIPDIAVLPSVVDNGYSDEATTFQTQVNAALVAEMNKLAKQFNIPIEIFDYSAASQKIRANPDQYKLTNLTDECVTYPNPEVCTSPDGYYFWDEYHPTRRVQQIVGEAMAEQLKKNAGGYTPGSKSVCALSA